MIINGQLMDGTILSDFNMVDVHMHIIPEVDDGAWSLEMADDMLRMSVIQGISKIICTSHSFAYNEKGDFVIEQFERLKNMAAEKYPEMKLFLGCEIACQKLRMDQILEKLEREIYPSMCGTKYVLTEFRTSSSSEDIVYCLERLLTEGWIPVVAHIERYPDLFQNKQVLKQLKSIGCLFQVNVYSLYEEENEGIKKRARMLVDEKMVDFLGSDGHKTYHRPPRVEAGLKYLYDNYDKEYIDQIAYRNPICYFEL